MAQFTKEPPKGSSKSLPSSLANSPVREAPPTLPGESTDRIAKYCCSLRLGTESHGSGFIADFEGLRSAKLLALDWKKRADKEIRKKAGEKEAREKREKIGELQTASSHLMTPFLACPFPI